MLPVLQPIGTALALARVGQSASGWPSCLQQCQRLVPTPDAPIVMLAHRTIAIGILAHSYPPTVFSARAGQTQRLLERTSSAPRGIGGKQTSVSRRATLVFPLALQARAMAAESSKQPDNFPYIQLWASADGETHIEGFTMKGFDLKKYASGEQLVKEGPKPLKVVFTELAVGLENDWHCCPQVQLVITLKGNWMIRTSEGTEKTMVPGDVLFQDNTADHPAAKVKKPQHFSSTVGEQPCQQLIVQLDRAPEADNPGALSA